MELKADRLTRKYDRKTAVDGMSFELQKGVTGLLGANGAGKTTLIKMMCGILAPTSGEITYDGVPVKSEEYRNVLGYLPQDFGYYPDFTGRDFLMYFAALKGLGKKDAKERCAELFHLVNLEDKADVKIRNYSGGMKQRIGIAQAIINRPEILILDEPTAGLDPGERVRFRNLIEELGKESIVLLSTHIVSDIEHVAGRIIMMRAGQIIWQGTWKEEDGSLEDFYLKQFESGSKESINA
ncbi:MAG: ABC transporter ATP-binding protein [Lachnospiraceae bacterium]|nr:ABC transporter ATP-binding protein [Lachnospiraceae bacterium]